MLTVTRPSASGIPSTQPGGTSIFGRFDDKDPYRRSLCFIWPCSYLYRGFSPLSSSRFRRINDKNIGLLNFGLEILVGSDHRRREILEGVSNYWWHARPFTRSNSLLGFDRYVRSPTPRGIVPFAGQLPTSPCRSDYLRRLSSLLGPRGPVGEPEKEETSEVAVTAFEVR